MCKFSHERIHSLYPHSGSSAYCFVSFSEFRSNFLLFIFNFLFLTYNKEKEKAFINNN